MRKILIIVFVLLCTIVKSQDVSLFVGGSSTGSGLFGMEFKSETYGGFVERYICKKDYPNYSDVNYINVDNGGVDMLGDTKYDGLMFGVNRHFKSMSNVLISIGVGLLTEIVLYRGYEDNVVYNHDSTPLNKTSLITSKKTHQKFTFEFSGGQDFEINDHFIMGLKAGYNTKTEIFGNVSIGYRF